VEILNVLARLELASGDSARQREAATLIERSLRSRPDQPAAAEMRAILDRLREEARPSREQLAPVERTRPSPR
jgi:hypothetical protein